MSRMKPAPEAARVPEYGFSPRGERPKRVPRLLTKYEHRNPGLGQDLVGHAAHDHGGDSPAAVRAHEYGVAVLPAGRVYDPVVGGLCPRAHGFEPHSGT